jgi:nucleoside-diphosphate-sugar epimerase
MRKVVVTGAAGSLGARVVSLLAARPDVERVVGVDLAAPDGDDDRAASHGDHDKIEAAVVDLAGEAGAGGDELAPLFTGSDGVVHLAWRTPDGQRRSASVEQAAADENQRALRRVLSLADACGVAQVVHLSSATVYGAWPDNQVPLTEEAPLRPNPEFSFAVGKAEAERVVAEWADGHPDVAVAVLRPAVTLGSPERPLYEALGGIGAPRGDDGARPVQFLHVDDLADAVVFALDRHLTGVFNVAADSGIREGTARALAGGVAKVALPRRLALQVARWGWHLRRRGVPKEAFAYSLYPWVIAADRLRAAGWAPRYSSEEAFVATDVRPHWDDLPPGQRQNATLVLVAVGAVVVVIGAVATVVVWRGRSRRPGRSG